MAFAQGNHVSHLLSGGYFIPTHILGASLEKASTSPHPEMLVVTNWCTVGPDPLNLICADQTIQSYLRLLGAGQQVCPQVFIHSPAVKISDADAVAIGRGKTNKEHPCPFNQTLTGQKLPGVADSSINQLYVTGTEVYLLNSDKCVIGQHMIIQPSHLNSLTFIASVRRSSLLDWKKDRNWTEPNCKRPDHWLRLHTFWNCLVASCDICQKIEKPKKNRSRPVATGLSSRHVLELTHAHFSLIVGLWIIKSGQKLVEIWPKTFLYATRMYIPSVFTISQPNLNRIAWNFNQSTGN